MTTDISTLPLAQQIDIILQSSGQDRLRQLMASPHLATIVPLLPPSELWLTVAEVGKNDALIVMEYATSEQWQLLFDLQAWNKDEFNPKPAIEWLETMLDIDAKRASHWVRELNPEFVVLLIDTLITVNKRDNKEDDPSADDSLWPSELPAWSLDNNYYIQGKTEEYDGLARKLLRQLADDDLGYFHHLCDTVLDILPIEQAETTYEIRARRLAEEGFPTHEDAMSIYQPLSISALKTLPKRPEQTRDGIAKEVVPHFPLVICDQSHLFISTVVADIHDGLFLQEWSLELAALATKVMIADARPLEPQELGAAMAKVVAMLNLAVEAASGGDIHKAAVLIQTYWAKHLFQIGCALMRAIPKK